MDGSWRAAATQLDTDTRRNAVTAGGIKEEDDELTAVTDGSGSIRSTITVEVAEAADRRRTGRASSMLLLVAEVGTASAM
jgi:hypothetical protein